MSFAGDYQGAWNIHVQTARGRVWWLKIDGTTGSFVGAPGGQVDPIPSITLTGGVLRFVMEKGDVRQVYSARLVDGELRGTMEQAGQPAVEWRGVRAPVIRDRDDGKWKEGAPVALFNGRDTSGWHLQVAGKPGWTVRDGLLVNEKGATELVSDAKFWNFILRAEYRYPQGSNSGIALRGRYEIQIQDTLGQPVNSHTHGGLYSRIAPSRDASKPPGEFQTLEARLVGRTLTVKLNGQTVIDGKGVEGPTAMVMDPNEGEPGPIVLQGDHGPIEFLKLEIVPLKR